MIRLRRDDLENPEKLARLAKSAGLTSEDFQQRFASVVATEPPALHLVTA